MIAWNCGFEFYSSPVMFKIKDAGSNRAGHELLREAILFRLLTFCAKGDTFRDVKQFSRIADVPINQARMVWNVCLDEGILRETRFGYSASEWMSEKGMMTPCGKGVELLPCEKKEVPKEKIQTESKTLNIVFEPNDKIELPKKMVPAKKDPPKENPLSRPIDDVKEYVRPNVRLTRSEMAKLKESFSDDEVTRMLDILSDYKLNSGRTYPSDYDAINRWVVRKIFEEKNSGGYQKVKFEAEELPDWVYGNAK